MIYYVVAENPDDRVIERAVFHMKRGEIVAFPTDTNWVFGADVNSKEGVELLYRLKKADRKHHFSLICDSISMANSFAQISDSVFKQIRGRVPGAYTFILPPTNGLPRRIRDYKKEREIGVRIPDSRICQELVRVLNGPMLSASITAETLGISDSDNEDCIYSYLIEEKFFHNVPLIIDSGEFEPTASSSIIDYSKGDTPLIIREGAGDVTPFL